LIVEAHSYRVSRASRRGTIALTRTDEEPAERLITRDRNAGERDQPQGVPLRARALPAPRTWGGLGGAVEAPPTKRCGWALIGGLASARPRWVVRGAPRACRGRAGRLHASGTRWPQSEHGSASRGAATGSAAAHSRVCGRAAVRRACSDRRAA